MGDDSAKLVIALSRSYNVLFTLIEKNVRNYGLTVSEFGVLEALLHKGELPVQKLCEKVLVTSGSMTYIVNKLEEKGYVKRYKCEKDARIWLVRLTGPGYEFISKIYPQHENFLRTILSEIDAAEKADLIESLFRMKDILERKP
jgi:MarR family 2-MHQ and catechol resistance regulon transcriptional repressor